MSGSGADDGGTPPSIEAISWIEAALQAALAIEGSARPVLAREALRNAGPPDLALEAWLEGVAAELQGASAVLVPDDMVDAIAARMLANRDQAVRAQANVAPCIANLLHPMP